MIYLKNSTEEQTIYIPRENTDIQSIKPISPNIPSDVLADYYTKEESNNKFATKQEVNEKVANLQEQIDNNGGGGSTSNIVYIYAQWDNNLSEEQWLDIAQNYPNKIYKIVLNTQSFEENGKEYKSETIVEVVGVNYEQYPQLEDNNGTIYNDCTLGFISGVHNNINYIWSREFGEYGYEMYVREEGIPSRQEVDDLSNTLYETANAIVPKIYYIDKNSLSLEDFNNIKNEVNNSKVILNFDGQNVEIIKTTDNALYAINCYWENENDTITYNELSDNGGGGSGSGSVNVYNETNSLGTGIVQTTKTRTIKSNLSIDEFDEIMTKLSNNERVILKNIQLNIEIVGFINKPYTEISFMGFSSSTIKGTYLGIRETSNLLIKWVKEDVDGETIVNIKIYNLSYLYNAIDAVQSNSIYTYTETNYSETYPNDIDSSLSSTDFEDMVNRFSTQQVAIYNTNGNFKVNIMTIKDNVLYGYYIKEDYNFGICEYYNDNGTIKYKFVYNIYRDFYTDLDMKTDSLKARIDKLTQRITALENK